MVDIDEPEEIARLLRQSGRHLWMRGRGDAIIAAANRFPEALLVPEIKHWVANAEHVQGNQATALRYFSELLGVEGR